MGRHSGSIIYDAFLKCTASALMDLLNCETEFCFRDSGRMIGWAGLQFWRASIQYAGFVEMNMCLHHTRCGELPAKSNSSPNVCGAFPMAATLPSSIRILSGPSPSRPIIFAFLWVWTMRCLFRIG